MHTNSRPILDTAADDTAADDTAADDMTAIKHLGCPPPTPEENRRTWAAWHQAMELSHEMLMSGLRREIGPEGDHLAAYRDWYERYQALKWEKNRAP